MRLSNKTTPEQQKPTGIKIQHLFFFKIRDQHQL